VIIRVLSRRAQGRLQQAGRRLLALLALAGFLAGTVGVPLPQPIHPGQDRSQAFPCMDHACGCASAEQCWQSCCCFTDHEKLAWAARHGVTPPPHVVAAAAREKPQAAASCCSSQRAAANCCEHHASCCGHESRDGDAAATAAGSAFTFVLAIQARKCQGQAELWLALGAVTPPPARFVVSEQSPAASEAIIRIAALRGISERPATPPPRA
jgi:hypothetical protein